MTNETWTAVDGYFADLLVQADTALEAAMQASEAAGLPPISVSPCMGKLLHLLTRMHRVRNILEIGTLGGYSTIWMARALPADGRLVTLEYEVKHANVARENIKRAGLDRIVELRVGRGVDSLAKLVAEKSAPFDFIFIDADKESYPEYLTWSLKLARVGTLIVADNIIRKGAVIDEKSADPRVQ